jgi:uncharacterized protein (TIGR02271 family)
MQDHAIVAIYDTPAHAELAVQDLLAANIPEPSIHRHAAEGSYAGGASAPTVRAPGDKGFWATMFGGEPDDDTAVYDRSVSDGSSAVSVRVSDDQVARVTDILEQHNPIDIDERAESYGLTKTTTTREPIIGQARGDDGTAPEDAMQLSEESLAVGKRMVNQGTTRIRRFVVETPVEQQVALHDERVTIERRPVTEDRAVAGAAFSDKTIEMTESAEEAVVSKTVRVKEEISLKKEVTDRTETIRDTVRREDVEIVKVPGEGNNVDPLARDRIV